MAGGGGAQIGAMNGPQPMHSVSPGGGWSMSVPPPQPPNIFDQSAGAYGNALNTANAAGGVAMGMGGPINFPQVQAGQVNPMMMGPGQAITPQQVNAQQIAGQFGPVQAQNIGLPSQVQAGQLAGTNLDPYMNPFTGAVTNQTLQDMERGRQMTRGSDAARAAAAGAFGGSRHGVVDAETNRAFDDNTARTLANLNMANFSQAQQGAQFDIGNRMQADQFNVQSGMEQQRLNQATDMQAQLANLQAQMRAAEMDQNTDLQAQLANQMTGLQAQITNLQNSTQRGLANQSTGLAAGIANQGVGLQAGTANQNAALQAAQLQQAGQNSQFNALSNLATTQGNLSNLGFGMGSSINNAMMGGGMAQQALMQQLIDQGLGQYAGFVGAPMQSTQGVNAAIGAVPGGGGQTQSYQPGLFDYLTAGAGLLSAFPFCWVAREVYGADNPAWLQFRDWMLERAPAWLRRAYGKHGPRWAEWVRRNPWCKPALRRLMDAVR